MADKKLSELTSITSADIASGDLLLVSDVSAGISKSITYGELTTINSVDINGGTIDGTVIGGTTPAAGSFTTGQFGTSLNVDGTVTADGVTTETSDTIPLTLNGGANATFIQYTGGSADDIRIGTVNSKAGFSVYNSTDDRYLLDVTDNGDISFYEDTGTTPKLFWDASAESLSIGSTASTSDRRLQITGSGVSTSTSQFGIVANPTFPTDVTDNLYNVYIGPNLTSGTTLTNLYNLYLEANNTTGSTVTDSFGLYQAGSNDKNYFAGDVGIGTSSPDAKIRIQNDNSTVPSLIIRDGGTPTVNMVHISSNATGTNFVIDSSGLVGIGRTPADGVLLDVQSTSSGDIKGLRIRNRGQVAGSSVSAIWSLNRDGSDIDFAAATIKAVKEQNWTTTASTVDSAMVFETMSDESSSEKMRIDSSGNVGIGESSIDSKFHVKTSIASTGVGSSSSPIVIIQNERTNTGTSSSVLQFDTNEITGTNQYARAAIGAEYDGSSNVNGRLMFSTADTSGNLQERLRIDSSGNVIVNSSGELRIRDDGTFIKEDQGLLIGNTSGTGTTRPIRFFTESTERLRINSSGNVGIGTSSPAQKLTIEGAAGYLATVQENSANNVRLQTYVDATQAALVSGYNTTAKPMTFFTGGSEAMRIDASGNLLVGQTSSTAPASGNVIGAAISPLGYISTNRTSVSAEFGTQNDGDIVVFRKSGTAVGSIATVSSRIAIGTGDVGLFLDNTNDRFTPIDQGNLIDRDAAIDLGYSLSRFKDLFLSGGIYLGGTGAANKLDDYEEGTFTPNINFGGGATGITYGNRSGAYVKIGNLVFVRVGVRLTAKGSSTGILNITGFPFTVESITYADATGATSFSGMSLANNSGLTMKMANGSTYALLAQFSTSAEIVLTEANLTDTSFFYASVCYSTTA